MVACPESPDFSANNAIASGTPSAVMIALTGSKVTVDSRLPSERSAITLG